MLSEREAAARFGSVGLSREQARVLLRTHVAGVGVRVGGATLYHESAVQALVARPVVNEQALSRVCPHGLHVVRLARLRALDLTRPWAEQAAAVNVQPRLPRWTDAANAVRVRAWGPMPWVVTVSGLVVFGAHTDGWSEQQTGAVAFSLEPPGSWFELLDRRWFAFGPGRHWFSWDPALRGGSG
jgi:hypothetical protein